VDKNVKPNEMKAIVRKRQQRRLVETEKGDLAFQVRGNVGEPEKIDRWMKRHMVAENTVYAPSPVACKGLYISVNCPVLEALT